MHYIQSRDIVCKTDALYTLRIIYSLVIIFCLLVNFGYCCKISFTNRSERRFVSIKIHISIWVHSYYMDMIWKLTVVIKTKEDQEFGGGVNFSILDLTEKVGVRTWFERVH